MTEADLPGQAAKAMFASDAADRPAFREWLDADAAVERYCARHAMEYPRDSTEVVNLHIHSIEEWIDRSTGDAS